MGRRNDSRRASGLIQRTADPAAAAVLLGAGRSALAAAIMAAPVVAARTLGADTATARRVTWLTRMTAVRDGALGAGGALAARRDPAAAVPWVVGGAAADLVDALALSGALRQGRIKGPVPAAIAALAAAAAGFGAVTAVRLRRR